MTFDDLLASSSLPSPRVCGVFVVVSEVSATITTPSYPAVGQSQARGGKASGQTRISATNHLVLLRHVSGAFS